MLKSTIRLALATVVIAAIGASQARADVLAYVGTTVGGPTWQRPIAGNPPTPPPSGVGTNVPYHVQPFFVKLSGTYSMQSASTIPAGWDNYTFLYQDTFSAGAPFTNVLIGNDDNPTIGLSGFNFALTAFTQYFLVTTGFGNTDEGAFTNTIQDVGNVFPSGTIMLGVPEPSPMALAGVAGLLGLLGRTASRRFRKSA
ncbi:MAG: hypothetical protein AB7I30_02805 [Isosphaeraceae bacterium]